MKALAEAALVGLERAGVPPANAEDAGERLVARTADLAPERAFLLRLGVHAVRARAGFASVAGAECPPPAAADSRPLCSARLAAIVAELCADGNSGNRSILAEALARIDARQLRLPPEVIPTLADLRDPGLLPAAARVCGERGRWLAQHNPTWSWLVDGVAPELLEHRRRAWDEGTPEARLSALRATRSDHPAEARAWIDAAWKAEKASLREELVATLAIGLSADDEPLLVRALGDRAAGVRAAAARLLARIDSSALAVRARARAEALLSYEAPGAGVFAALKSRLAGKGHGILAVAPPAAFARDWADDGLIEKPPAGTGERAFWLGQILSLVSPAHWELRFNSTPESLVKAAIAVADWAESVLAAWTEATVLFEARAWAAALWDARATRLKPEKLADIARALFPLMDPATVQDAATAFVDGSGPLAWNGVLAAVSRPWSRSLSDSFLRTLARGLANAALTWQEAAAWRTSLDLAGAALPVVAFDQALALEPPAGDAPGGGPLRNALETFRSVVTIRKRIDEETRS